MILLAFMPLSIALDPVDDDCDGEIDDNIFAGQTEGLVKDGKVVEDVELAVEMINRETD